MSDQVFVLLVKKRINDLSKLYKVFGTDAQGAIAQDDYVYHNFGDVRKYQIVRKTIYRSDFAAVFPTIPTGAQEMAEFAFWGD